MSTSDSFYFSNLYSRLTEYASIYGPQAREFLSDTSSKVYDFVNTYTPYLSNALQGWSIGFTSAQLKNKENEVKQGKNYVFAVLPVVGQLFVLSILVTAIVAVFFPHWAVGLAVGFGGASLALSTLPILFLFASIKQGTYSSMAEWVTRKVPFSKYVVPLTLGPLVSRVAGFFAEHTGDLARVAIIIGAVALTVIGNPFLGGAVLMATGYQFIDDFGLIPRRISLFMERYQPIIQSIGLMLSLSPLAMIMGGGMLVVHVAPAITRYTHCQMDRLIHFIYQKIMKETIGIPSLKEIDAPLIEQKNLSYKDILSVLEGNDEDFELNPAHYSKWTHDVNSISKNYQFGDLLDIFNRIKWEDKGSFTIKKLKADDRFIDFVNTECPNRKIERPIYRADEKSDPAKEQLFETLVRDSLLELAEKNTTFRRSLCSDKPKNISEDEYIDTLIRSSGKHKNEYLIAKYAEFYMRRELSTLVSLLRGDLGMRVRGKQSDLETSRELAAQILTYLKSLDPQKDFVDIEDTLCVLAVEGGNYCGRGIKTAMQGCMSRVYSYYGHKKKDMAENKEKEDDFLIKSYESELRQTLQDSREEIIKKIYKSIVNKLKVPASIFEDVHAFDIYRLILSQGFYPMTDYEIQDMGFNEFSLWEQWGLLGVRSLLYNEYQESLDNRIAELDYQNLASYVRAVLNANPQLSQAQKEQINGQPDDHEGEYVPSLWETLDDAQHRFNRLALYMMGVMRKKV